MESSRGILANRLRVVRRKEIILDNLSFTVKPGRLTGLIGPSGSGKTTLMRAVVGAQNTTGGLLSIEGSTAGARCLRSKIGYVSQDAAIYGDLTIQQNLSYIAELVSAPKGQLDDILNKVRLDECQHRLVSLLSGGQKARVSLAVALLGNPRVLVMDEPTVGLDPLLRKELWNFFRELADEGKTLLVSSHVMDEAERCDDLLLLREGKLLWQDSRAKLLKKTETKTVEEAFLTMISREDRA